MPKIYINNVLPGKVCSKDTISSIQYQKNLVNKNERLEAFSHFDYNTKFIDLSKLFITNSSKLFTTNLLIAATHISFDSHLPLIIGPDIIWNTIMQGVSKHINENSEEFRHIFVTHKEKELIEIERDDLIKGQTNDKWQEITKEFIREIIDNCHNDSLNKAIKLRFSTTTPIQDAVHDMTFMDAVKSYFKYQVTTKCGIPYIDIEGTVEDWINIRDSLNILDELNLTSWKLKLQNILNHFIEVYNNIDDKEFWNNIYLHHGPRFSGQVTTVSGWISDLFLYIKDNKIDYSNETLIKYSPGDFPSAMISTPFIWDYFGDKLNMKFVSGLIGVKVVDDSIGSITPELGWRVTEILK